MIPTNNTPRLLAAAKEFNIGKETLVEFLADKGFEINSNPSTKLTEQMYKALQIEFAQDKLAKQKSEGIALPKGSYSDNQRKPKEALDFKKEEAKPLTTAKPATAETRPLTQPVAQTQVAAPSAEPRTAPVEAPPKPEVTIPATPLVKPQPAPEPRPVAAEPKPVVEAPKPAIPETKPAVTEARPQVAQPHVAVAPAQEPKPVVAEPKPAAAVPSQAKPVQETEKQKETISEPAKIPIQEKKEEPQPRPAMQPPAAIAAEAGIKAPVTEKRETIATQTPAPKVDTAPADTGGKPDDKTMPQVMPAPATKAIEKEPEAPAPPEHIEIKAPRIEGPNILGKINLDNMNLASRPKKGSAKKKEEEKRHEKQSTQHKQGAKPQGHGGIVHKKDPQPFARPEEVRLPRPVVQEREPNPEEDAAAKPEHIEMKAPKLEGPKIIGKIELPVSQPSGNTNYRPDHREKRKRKRIPVEKKPETHKADPNSRNRERTPGQGHVPGAPGAGHGHGHSGGQGQPGTGGQVQNRERRPSGPQTGHGGQGHGHTPGHGGPGHGGGSHGGNGQQGGQRQGGPARQSGRDSGGGDRRGVPPSRNLPLSTTSQQQEIDTKAIQDKIRETQAKLSGSTRSKNLKAKYRRNKRDEMADKRAAAENAEQGNVIQVTEFISVSELASLLNVSFADVISKCMSLGIMVSINQRLDAEVIELVASEFSYDVEFINLEQEAEEVVEDFDDEEDLQPRAPIVTIMGHVDHGKTSLLDYVRSANVVAGEAGGITQHIGAYQVTTAAGKKITFLDTPGHEAFTAMRARGAKVADVAVIVVAADDAIMPQTKEAISHAQAANLPMIFAINKIDKPGANPEKIKEQLANMNILVEDWGGKFQSQEISAKKGQNIDLLLEKIGLEAELLELRANPDRNAAGSVIEASLDKGRGYQSTILVQNGTLNQGDMIACGQHYGKIKAMFNERGQRVKSAGPSTPVQVLGLNGAPQAGEKFRVFEDEDEAKNLANHRAQILREQGIRARKHITLDEIGRRLALGNFKELGVIIKGDFDGSVEALSDSLQKLSTEEVAINVVHKGVGQITESDVLLATASDAIIIGFQVRPSSQAAKLAEQENIEIRTYSIIYDAIDEIKSAMEGLLEPKVEKKTVCNIEVREIFKISGVGTIAGCYVLDGKMTRQTKLNLVRDGIVVYTGELASLKRHKDDVKEVNAGYECGLAIKNYNDVRAGDIIEGFEEVEVKRTL